MREINQTVVETKNAVARAAEIAITAVRDIVYTVAASYWKGIRFVYDKTNGNDALKLDDATPPVADDFNLFELFLHLTLSGAWIFGLLGTFTAHTARTTATIFSHSADLVLAKEDEIGLAADNRTFFNKYVLGVLGLILGIGFGALGFASIAIGRGITNNWKSAQKISETMINAVLAEDDHIDTNEDNRSFIRKYVIGLVGLGLGFVAGLMGMITVVTGRVVTNSWKTGLQLAVGMVNIVKETPIHIDQDDRHSVRKYLVGFLGLLPGFIAGVLGGGTVGLLRLSENGRETAKHTIVTIVNFVLATDDAIQLEADNRSFARKYLAGFLGLLIGGAVGFVGAIAIVGGRMVTNNWKTAAEIAATMTNVALAENSLISIDPDDRSLVRKYVVGMVGLVVGIVAGLTGIMAVASGRTLGNSWETTKLTAGYILNTALSENRQITMNEERPKKEILGWGAVGLVIGALVGLALAAIPFSARKILPLLAGIATSPFTAAWRMGREASKWYYDNLRFSRIPLETKDPNEKLRDLYNALTSSGRLPEGMTIQKAPNDPYSTHGMLRSLLKFIRKSVTFNAQTVTERTLSNFHKALQPNRTVAAATDATHLLDPVSGVSLDEIAETVLQKTKARYDESNPKHSTNIEIEKVVKFVMLYLWQSASSNAREAYGQQHNASESDRVPQDLYRVDHASFFRPQVPAIGVVCDDARIEVVSGK